MKLYGVLHVLKVEPVRQIRQHHHRELQPLGLVDAHQGHGLVVLLLGQAHAVLLETVQMVQKLVQAPRPALFKGRKDLQKLPQPRKPHGPACHAAIDRGKAGLFQNQLIQPVQRQKLRRVAKLG